MGHGRPGWRRVTTCTDTRTDAPTEVPADLLAAYISDLLTEEPAVPVTVIRERVLGAADVAEHLGVKPDTVHKWGARRLLPPPDLMVSGAAAWWESTIDQWASERKAR